MEVEIVIDFFINMNNSIEIESLIEDLMMILILSDKMILKIKIGKFFIILIIIMKLR